MRAYKTRLQRLFLLTIVLFLIHQQSISQKQNFNLTDACKQLPHINGETRNAEYLYTTAGNKIYCIGNQAGNFPPVGFHVLGEMGGIWQHPIKLLDGFRFNIKELNTIHNFTSVCDSFIAYSFATKFHYQIQDQNLSVTQTQFVPDNLEVLAVEYKIQNNSSQRKKIEFELNLDINLMPVWLSERINKIDGCDKLSSFDKQNHVLIFKDSINTWLAGIGFENTNVQFKGLKKTTYKGKGVSAIISITCDLAGNKSQYFRFYISGSTHNSNEIIKNISVTKNNLQKLFDEKEKRFHSIESTAEIKVPDTLLQIAYNWGKYATDWLRRDIPDLGKGLSAGLPDYPWFFSNDQASTFTALTGTIKPQLFYDAYSMLKKVSDKANDGNGRIIHEVSTNGVVYAKGNMQESQLHIIAAWQIFQWTGNINFLKENYLYAQRTWKWLQQHDTNHNGYIEGYGGVEIEGLDDEMLDVQINTYLFLEVLSKMAIVFDDQKEAINYASKATTLKNKINKDWWLESENCYADFLSTKEKALQIIDDALTKRVQVNRNKWAQIKLTELKASILNNTYPYNGYLVYYNGSILDPVIAGMTDTARALQMLKRVSFFTNKFGVYIAGIERPDEISIDEKSFQKDSAFTYNRAVMPAATSGIIQAAARYGLIDTALKYVHIFLNNFSYATPGTTYEVSPDYGMFVQAWNISCLNIPLIQYFFGVDPNAYKKEITIRLQMPSKWNDASIKNLLIGNNKLSIDYKKEKNQIKCIIQSTDPGWKIHFVIDKQELPILVNKKMVDANKQTIELTGLKNSIQYEGSK
jgi:hypothetical protein